MLSRFVRQEEPFTDRKGYDQLKAKCTSSDLATCQNVEKGLVDWCLRSQNKGNCDIGVQGSKNLFCDDDARHVYCTYVSTTTTQAPKTTRTTTTTTEATTTEASSLPLILGCTGGGFLLALVVLCIFVKCLLARRHRAIEESRMNAEQPTKKKKKKRSRTQRSTGTSGTSTGRTRTRKSTGESSNLSSN